MELDVRLVMSMELATRVLLVSLFSRMDTVSNVWMDVPNAVLSRWTNVWEGVLRVLTEVAYIV